MERLRARRHMARRCRRPHDRRRDHAARPLRRRHPAHHFPGECRRLFAARAAKCRRAPLPARLCPARRHPPEADRRRHPLRCRLRAAALGRAAGPRPTPRRTHGQRRTDQTRRQPVDDGPHLRRRPAQRRQSEDAAAPGRRGAGLAQPEHPLQHGHERRSCHDSARQFPHRRASGLLRFLCHRRRADAALLWRAHARRLRLCRPAIR